MTLRDLFRWAERFRLANDDEKANGKQLLAENGTALFWLVITCMPIMLVIFIPCITTNYYCFFCC